MKKAYIPEQLPLQSLAWNECVMPETYGTP